MAKGRRNCTTGYNSDHLLGPVANSYGGYMTSGRTADDLPDLVEEDVWSSSSPLSTDDGGWKQRSQAERHVGGLSLAFDGGYYAQPTVMQQCLSSARVRPAAAASAPVNVPAWPRFMRVDSAESLEHELGGLDRSEGDKEDDVADNEWVPPHEYLAREHSRRQSGAVATSVFEGVGRKLKGRDLSRIRDAVWSRTGFFG